MINKTERQVIFGKHVKEGDDFYEATIKTNDLVKHQKALKILSRDYSKSLRKIENLEKQISILKDKLKESKQSKPTGPLIKIESKKNNTFQDDVYLSEVRRCHVSINRIKNNLDPTKYYTKNEIKKNFIVQSKHIDFSLSHLKSEGILESFIIDGKIKYKLTGRQ
jgi:hypothetical protein